MFKHLFSRQANDIDVERTITTSQQLNIAEFELFGLAWQEWYGTAASETELEQYFLPYVFDGQVPFWVRKFCLDLIDNPTRCQRFVRPAPHPASLTPWDSVAELNVLIA